MILILMQWNVLNDSSYTKGKYPNTLKEHFEWSYRKVKILQEIQDRNPDIICLSEVTKTMEADFNLEGYNIYTWIDEEIRHGFGLLVAIRNNIQVTYGRPGEFKNVLSDTGRINFFYFRLKGPDGAEFYLYSTHLKAKGKFKEERKNEAEQIVKLIAEKELPGFVVGDLNAYPEEEALSVLKKKLKLLDANPDQNTVIKTSLEDNKLIRQEKKIDYILYSESIIKRKTILFPLDKIPADGCPGPQCPSDHLPTTGEFEVCAPPKKNVFKKIKKMLTCA